MKAVGVIGVELHEESTTLSLALFCIETIWHALRRCVHLFMRVNEEAELESRNDSHASRGFRGDYLLLVSIT